MRTHYFLLGVLLFLCIDAHALRCGTRLVQIDDLKMEVIKKCGNPLSSDVIGYVDTIKHHDRITVFKREELIYQINGRYVGLVFEGNLLVEIRREH